MTEHTNETMSNGYTTDGRALEMESLPADQPVGAAPAATEAKGFELEAESLPPEQPVADVAPAAPEANPVNAGYGEEGRELERESLVSQEPTSVPDQPVMPYSMPQAQPQAVAAADAQQAYHATYGAPSAGQPQDVPQPYGAPAQPVHPAPIPPKPKKPVDARRVFLTCGLVVGCIMIVFGLCMLAFYTPNAYEQAAQAVAQMGFMDDFSSYASPSYIGASDAEVIKTGFSLLLISLGATNICAFGAKLFGKKN